MESLIKVNRSNSESNVPDGSINSAMVDKIADIVAQVLGNKSEVSQGTMTASSLLTDNVPISHHLYPRQNSLPTLTMPYMPRTPAKESYTLEDFQCKYCHRPFFSKRELSKHTESAHFAEVYKPSHCCQMCMTSFPSDKELALHLQSNHSELLQDGSNVCKLCCQKFRHHTILSKHMAIFHIPHMECNFCAKVFNSVSLLWNHINFDHKAEPKEVLCNLCTACFTNPDDYNNHQKMVHAYPCSFCNTSVQNKAELRSHIEQNHGKYICEDCFETYDDIESFIQHFVTNETCKLSSDNLVCFHCKARFPNIKLIYRHLCLDNFSCILCSTKLISCRKYLEHLRKVHQTSVSYSEVDPNSIPTEFVPKTNSSLPSSHHRLTPTIKSETNLPPEFFKAVAAKSPTVSNSGSTVNYIHNLIKVNENLLNSKPMILSKYPGSVPTSEPPVSQASQLLKLCNTSELMKYIQANGLQSAMVPTSPPEAKDTTSQDESEMDTTVDSIKTEEDECRSPEDGESMNTENHPESSTDFKLEKFSPRTKGSFSSLEDDESKPELPEIPDTDELPDIDSEFSSESRRNSLRLKYQQLSISRKQRRSSKTNLHKMLQKTKVDDIVADTSTATARSSFQCQRCAKTFSTRSLLSRHWATATKCYICSISVCDLKVLNEHMKSVHSEYS